MKYIFYNTMTSTIEGDIRNTPFNGIWDSKLSDVPGWLPQHIIELHVIQSNPPQYDPTTEYITDGWDLDLDNKTLTRTYKVLSRTQEEIEFNTALQQWRYPDFAKRIIAPVSLATNDIGAKMYVWFKLNDLPVIKTNENTVHLYCNTVLPEHQAIVDDLQGIVTIEDRPEILGS